MARPTLAAHPKFSKLVARLRGTPMPRSSARGLLELIWEAGYASGDPYVGDAEAVEALADWTGAPGVLAGHLVAVGFLDRDEQGGHYIHDLADHAPDYVARRMAREEERRRKGTSISEIRALAASKRQQTSDSDSKRISFAANVQPPAPAPAPESYPSAGARAIQEPLPPPRAPYRPFPVGAATPAFEAVFSAYPRKDAKLKAAAVFQELAESYDGGEGALSTAILAAFKAGMLRRPPYSGENKYRPLLETVLRERRWEDPQSAPDDAPKTDERCAFHRGYGGLRQLPRAGPVSGCPVCREVSASRGTRVSEPEPPKPPDWISKPPPQWTAEQRAEAAELLRAKG